LQSNSPSPSCIRAALQRYVLMTQNTH
jgi:hypothetical protein